MTKEYTGPEFEIEFARAWLKYVEAGKVGIDPRKQWEVKWPHESSQGWQINNNGMPSFMEVTTYRWKPAPKRMVTIGYIAKHGYYESQELVAPEREALAMGTKYWSSGVVGYSQWGGNNLDRSRLAKADVFLTPEDAHAMADWLAVCRNGGNV